MSQRKSERDKEGYAIFDKRHEVAISGSRRFGFTKLSIAVLFVFLCILIGLLMAKKGGSLQKGKEITGNTLAAFIKSSREGQGVAIAESSASFDSIVIHSIDYKMAYIPPGSFIMGSPGRPARVNIDQTQHRVVISKGFYMGITEVTQSQWESVMGENPSYFKKCGGECPVENVSWDDCQEFIKRLNLMEGGGLFRLPTEAEWEYACRAGSQTAIYTGPMDIKDNRIAAELDPIAWYAGNSCADYHGVWDCLNWPENIHKCRGCGVHPVARKEPNIWGLYDMLGNVWEWCQDWYGGYPADQVIDPRGPSNGRHRIFRGGGWMSGAQSCCCGYRNYHHPDYHYSTLGLRLAGDLHNYRFSDK
ncbi:formylglycine-generating enzyme family protein [bacterium]|nr:formylglycine-generating enzyme family protein [bacterium]